VRALWPLPTSALRVRRGLLVAVILVLVHLRLRSVGVRRCSPAWLLDWLGPRPLRPPHCQRGAHTSVSSADIRSTRRKSFDRTPQYP
jgi:hypothetical protein